MFESGSDGEISQEVVDEQFAIFLSRDYASLLGMYACTCLCMYNRMPLTCDTQRRLDTRNT